MWERVYDQAAVCQSCQSCPIVEINHAEQRVRISDPAKPKSGTFTMTLEEYRIFFNNAPRSF
ncbi:hypothetical protein KJ781_00365 [Patescibacteria group bacterium]|nr:hypothetical protein [Patescibacteria group bacterium]MBU1448490.1 hypothetical protein [Patescibacteria group bacterium]MBU2613254.1 hypothetical protein [Patescibacteria group bacterium]